VFVILEIHLSVFENHTQDFLEIQFSFVELQLLLLWYFVLWTRFSFELSGDDKRNTVNRPIIYILKLLSGR